MNEDTIREALLWEAVDGAIRCLTCERRCELRPGALGWCRTRKNEGGRLITLIYGAVSSLSVNAIEKKPFYHFYPGSRAFTMGSWSCNFGCPWCQNWHISKNPPPPHPEFMLPIEFVKQAQGHNCQGTSISFNEPTLSLEWSLEVFRLAREQGLYNTFVTNGYMSASALELLVDAGLDAMNVDIKGQAPAVRKYCQGIEVEHVWERCRQARTLDLHLEITTLLIPGVNDATDGIRQMATRIAEELGSETPWHLSAYYPAYHFHAAPTPVATLEQAQQLGREAGLHYVYVGNVPGHAFSHTSCPSCGIVLLERLGFSLQRSILAKGRCPACGQMIAGRGWDWKTK
jgi:pyruvate formate lyase activating enzyme